MSEPHNPPVPQSPSPEAKALTQAPESQPSSPLTQTQAEVKTAPAATTESELPQIEIRKPNIGPSDVFLEVDFRIITAKGSGQCEFRPFQMWQFFEMPHTKAMQFVHMEFQKLSNEIYTRFENLHKAHSHGASAEKTAADVIRAQYDERDKNTAPWNFRPTAN